MADKLCIYHKNCLDGFGAAYAVWKKFREDCEYLASSYNDPAPDVKGKEVYLVDFSYKKQVIDKMLQEAASVTILDHHKTAIEDLSDMNLNGVLDESRSGAVIAWEYFHPDKRIPDLLLFIQDRDLWKFKIYGTKAVTAGLMTYPYEFDLWDKMIRVRLTADLAKEGDAIIRKQEKDIAEIMALSPRKLKIAGKIVPAVNASYMFASDLGHILDKGEAFAAIYNDVPEGRCFSLRSDENGDDVSIVAKQYGGGGHRHASGFIVSFKQALEFEIESNDIQS